MDNQFSSADTGKVLVVEKTKLANLLQETMVSGATDAVVIPTTEIIVDPELAEMCHEPGCENYGASKNCPTYISSPELFKKNLENYQQGIFFKIAVLSRELSTSRHLIFFKSLHEIAAGIETSAIQMGFKNALAYAGGSCKEIFCFDYAECLALSDKAECRNPEHARPSMSGFGINVTKLIEVAGWPNDITNSNHDSLANEFTHIYGLILIN